MTRRKGAPAEADESLRVLAEIFTPTVAIVGKTWGLHLSKVLRVSRDENLRMIDDSVRFLTAQGKRVVYDAEHFFDAWRDDRELRAALRDRGRRGGRRGRLPVRHQRGVAAAVRRGRRPRGHGGAPGAASASTRTTTATAPSPTASWPSTPAPRQVQGTINGYGERCGNANLVSIIPALKLKMGYAVVSDEQLERLTETSHFVADVCQRGHLGARALRGPLRLRPQGRHARGRRREGAADVRARRPRDGRQRAAHRRLRALRQGHRGAQGAGARPRSSRATTRASPRCSSGSRTASTRATTTRPPTPPSTCCCARSSRRTSRCSASRASA